MIKELMAMFAKLPETDPKLDLEIAERQKRMRDRMEEIKAEMGDKYILHPSHKKGRLDEPRPV